MAISWINIAYIFGQSWINYNYFMRLKSNYCMIQIIFPVFPYRPFQFITGKPLFRGTPKARERPHGGQAKGGGVLEWLSVLILLSSLAL